MNVTPNKTPPRDDLEMGLRTMYVVQHCLARTHMLTVRQRDVLRLVSAGATNSQICSRLGIAGPTVENHIKDLKYRLRVDSRSLLAVVGYFEIASNVLGKDASCAMKVARHGETLLIHQQSLPGAEE